MTRCLSCKKKLKEGDQVVASQVLIKYNRYEELFLGRDTGYIHVTCIIK